MRLLQLRHDVREVAQVALLEELLEEEAQPRHAEPRGGGGGGGASPSAQSVTQRLLDFISSY